jgi:hypothetical protein
MALRCNALYYWVGGNDLGTESFLLLFQKMHERFEFPFQFG